MMGSRPHFDTSTERVQENIIKKSGDFRAPDLGESPGGWASCLSWTTGFHHRQDANFSPQSAKLSVLIGLPAPSFKWHTGSLPAPLNGASQPRLQPIRALPQPSYLKKIYILFF